VIAHGAEPVEIRKHLLDLHHDALDALGDPVHALIAGLHRKSVRDALDNLVAGIGDRVHRVAEADDHFLARDALTHVGLGTIGVLIGVLNLEGRFVGAPMFRSAQRADRPGNARVEV
jgi:hypothetical protein